VSMAQEVMLANHIFAAFLTCLFIVLRCTANLGLAAVRWLVKLFLGPKWLQRDQVTIPLRSSTNASDQDPAERQPPRLGLQSSLIQSEYDVVVIGSGYGGGVAASRMARAGQSVCVLERGDEKWPGEYPHTLGDALRQYRMSFRLCGKTLSIGHKGALFQTVTGDGQDCFVGCGLGGTSLINGGVFLRPDDRVFQGAEWPEPIRHGAETLAKGRVFQ
jgi:hypothetical protein